jgi:hypothetical protein
MTWSRKVWVALALGTTVTLLAMRIGLALLRHLGGEVAESEESLWITSNGDLGELPLEQSRCFAGNVNAVGNVSPPHVAEFQRILHQARAEETFEHLAHLGPEGARLYGLCGLRALRSTRLPHYMALAIADERKVALRHGCTIQIQRVREAVQNPGFWAMCDGLRRR